MNCNEHSCGRPSAKVVLYKGAEPIFGYCKKHAPPQNRHHVRKTM